MWRVESQCSDIKGYCNVATLARAGPGGHQQSGGMCRHQILLEQCGPNLARSAVDWSER